MKIEYLLIYNIFCNITITLYTILIIMISGINISLQKVESVKLVRKNYISNIEKRLSIFYFKFYSKLITICTISCVVLSLYGLFLINIDEGSSFKQLAGGLIVLSLAIITNFYLKKLNSQFKDISKN